MEFIARFWSSVQEQRKIADAQHEQENEFSVESWIVVSENGESYIRSDFGFLHETNAISVSHYLGDLHTSMLSGREDADIDTSIDVRHENALLEVPLTIMSQTVPVHTSAAQEAAMNRTNVMRALHVDKTPSKKYLARRALQKQTQNQQWQNASAAKKTGR